MKQNAEAKIRETRRVIDQSSTECRVKGKVSSSSMEHFISRQTTTNLWVFCTSGNGNALNYINLMHKICVVLMRVQLFHLNLGNNWVGLKENYPQG